MGLPIEHKSGAKWFTAGVVLDAGGYTLANLLKSSSEHAGFGLHSFSQLFPNEELLTATLMVALPLLCFYAGRRITRSDDWENFQKTDFLLRGYRSAKKMVRRFSAGSKATN